MPRGGWGFQGDLIRSGAVGHANPSLDRGWVWAETDSDRHSQAPGVEGESANRLSGARPLLIIARKLDRFFQQSDVRLRDRMRQSNFSKSFTVSLLLHAGLLGALILLARPPLLPDRPLRVRIEEPPPPPVLSPSVPSAPRVAPRPLPAPGRDRIQTERVDRGRSIPPDSPAPRGPAFRSGSSEPGAGSERAGQAETAGTAPPAAPVPQPPAAPAPGPQVAARPAPEVSLPPAEPPRDSRQETAPAPERGGLSLSSPPAESSKIRTPSGSGDARPARPSLRDQIASLGSGLVGESLGPAKQTIPLDSREPRFLSYLARLKARIQAEWMYPEEARRVGMGGELHLVFTLNKAGSLVNIRLLESSGFPILDNEALRAVKAAAPFDPFPPQLGDDPWNILATFHYHSPYYRRN